MALFFDAPWFDEKLSARELNRADLAVVAEMDDAELALVFKDQMELSAGQVSAFAELLGVSVAEIADRAGISTPVPSTSTQEDRIVAMERRVAVLEAEVARLSFFASPVHGGGGPHLQGVGEGAGSSSAPAPAPSTLGSSAG